jgi:hypothetical protein
MKRLQRTGFFRRTVRSNFASAGRSNESLRYDKQSWFLEAAAIKLHGADPPAVSNESGTVTGTAYFKKTRLCVRARLESCATGENISALAAAKPQGPQDQRSATKAFVVIVLWRR